MIHDAYVRELVEKAAPKPPIMQVYAEQRYYYCPVCRKLVHQRGIEMCDRCRQRLDWEEAECACEIS